MCDVTIGGHGESCRHVGALQGFMHPMPSKIENKFLDKKKTKKTLTTT